MAYLQNRHRRLGYPMSGFGDFSDDTQCSQIPAGDPYRKPGNYCATPDGGQTTFNADGSTYRAPGAVDPDPAHPAGSSSSSGSGIWGAILSTLNPGVPTTATVPVASSGMSTSTVLLLGGAALAAVLLLRR